MKIFAEKVLGTVGWLSAISCPLSEANTTCCGAAITFGAAGPRQPSPFEPSELSGPWGFSIALSASCFFSSLSVGRLT